MVKKPKFELKNKHSNQKHVVKFYIFFIKCDGMYFNHFPMKTILTQKTGVFEFKKFRSSYFCYCGTCSCHCQREFIQRKKKFLRKAIALQLKIENSRVLLQSEYVVQGLMGFCSFKKTNTKYSSDLIKLVIIVSEQF